MEQRGGESPQPMIAQLQPRMLAGDVKVRRLTKPGEGTGDRTELDGFRARSDDERNAILTQLPP